jgi:hypothetical protein
MEFLDKLKRKPKHVRQRIALVTSGALSALIFVMWWTNFTASTEDSSQTSLSEALSPVGALAGMVHNTVAGVSTFSEDLKTKVTQIQYEASSSISAQSVAAVSTGIDGYTPHTQDVIYPEQIFPKESPPINTNETKSATGTSDQKAGGTD